MKPALETTRTALTTEFGVFDFHVFREPATGLEHAAMVLGEVADGAPVLARVHSECLTGDVFHSLHCDCGRQLDKALRVISHEGRGALLYLRQEGRGIGLFDKIRAYELQHAGADTVDANRMLGLPDDARDYGVAAEILARLGIARIRLLTNNPAKIAALEDRGIVVSERVAIEVEEPHPRTAAYLRAKAARMGHLLAADEPLSPHGRPAR